MQVLEHDSLRHVIDRICIDHAAYSNFNLLVFDVFKNQAHYYGSQDTGHPQGTAVHTDELALSNGTLSSDWPKMAHGLQLVRNAVCSAEDEESMILEIFLALLDPKQFAPEVLPRNTVVDLEMEAELSSVFIPPFGLQLQGEAGNHAKDTFGTVSSAVILVSQDDVAEFLEVSWREYEPADRAGTLAYMRKHMRRETMRIAPPREG